MPLLDHFHPPLEKARHWEGFHTYWASAITQWLNEDLLPSQFVAEPHVCLSIFVEADVATFEEARAEPPHGMGLATEVYAPPKPSLVIPVDWKDLDLFEVQIYREEGENRLVAAIEVVSPSNKDRPSHREAFVRKCASYLQEGVSVVVVDVVTSRSGDFHSELLRMLGQEALIAEESLRAAAYRTITSKRKTRVEAWAADLALGENLPTLPLWLAPDLVVPLDLEQTYQHTCASLRIPHVK